MDLEQPGPGVTGLAGDNRDPAPAGAPEPHGVTRQTEAGAPGSGSTSATHHGVRYIWQLSQTSISLSAQRDNPASSQGP